MNNQYDGIFRENFEEFYAPFIERHLDIDLRSAKDVPRDLVRTHERKPDFLKLVEPEGADSFVLHVEVQTRNDSTMIDRMRLYHALLMDEYHLPVRQLVLFLGKKPSRMRKKARQEEIFFGFEVLEISKLDANEFLASAIPGEIILAVLADFGDRPANQIIQEILSRLQSAKKEKSELEKALQQLLVFSSLSNLVELVRKEIERMPLTIDVRNTSIYREGKKEGVQQGMRQGVREGKREIVLALLADGELSLEKISRVTKMPIEEIIALQDQKP